MTAHSHASDLARELTVIYADLPVQAPAEEPSPILDLTFMLWPQQVCDVAADSRLVLHRKMIDLVQRNLNASFSLLRRLAGARNLGEMVQLQAAHFSNQLTAAVGQSEELAALSIKTALAFARGAYPGHSQD
jgi:hypothetical protein